MSQTIPKALFSSTHSAFALIDPTTSRYNRILDRHGALRSGLKMHVAISYVWSEWKDHPSDQLPNWHDLRNRLLAVVGPQTPAALRKQTWNASSCWLDSKCIDQDSGTDKAYWIPKMDEVYHEAECTVLLLRGEESDLTVLGEVAREMSCRFTGKVPLAERMLGPHSCLLTQSCTKLPDLSREREDECLRVLETFAAGTWRRRAWIFQEILLSRNYLVSWSQDGWTSLANIGVIAALLFQKDSKLIWLEHFSSWCRRVEYLRQYYETTSFCDLSDANVLQMASELEATVACDKYYALCGILRLKRVQYDSTHTAERALHTIVEALTNAGRLSWLYAVPPSIENTGIGFAGTAMAPFVLTRMDGGKLIARTRSITMNNRTLGLDMAEIGIVTSVEPLHQLLVEVKTLLEKINFSLDDILKHLSENEVERLYHIPSLVFKAAIEVIAPLLLEPVFGDICQVLSINVENQSSKAWIMILLLSFLDLEKYFQEVSTADLESTAVSVVKSASLSIRSHLQKIENHFALIRMESVSADQRTRSRRFTLGFNEVPKGSKVYALEADKNILLAADPDKGDQNYSCAAFRGMIFQLEVGEMIGLVPSSIFGAFRKPLNNGEKTHLTFMLRDIDPGHA